MNCVTCGSKLPSKASACPACGTPASYSSDSNGSGCDVPLILYNNSQLMAAEKNEQTQPQHRRPIMHHRRVDHWRHPRDQLLIIFQFVEFEHHEHQVSKVRKDA